MKTVFTSSYSNNNIGVFNLSLKNHVDYCKKHGYDLINYKEEYSPHLDISRIKQLFKDGYDIIVTIGTDVIIQKMNSPITDYIASDTGITMCREIANGHALNGDLIILIKSGILDNTLDTLENTQYRFDSTQSCINKNKIPVSNSPWLQIAAPNMNPAINYSPFNINDYFSIHYHTIGKVPAVTEKIVGMRKGLKLI